MQGHRQSDVNCEVSPLSLTVPAAWGPVSTWWKPHCLDCLFQETDKTPFHQGQTGGKAGTAHLATATGAPVWLLFQDLFNNSSRSSARSQAASLKTHSVSICQHPMSQPCFLAHVTCPETTPKQGSAVASLPTLKETY